MKTHIIIIEDNDYKYFTTKAVIEAQLKLPVSVVDVTMSGDIVDTIEKVAPDLIVFRPNGGVAELLEKLKKRNTNRRNTEITLLLAEELDADMARYVADFTLNYVRGLRTAKAA